MTSSATALLKPPPLIDKAPPASTTLLPSGKKAIPKLHDIYQEELLDKGIKVFAVYTQGDQEEWNEFIEEHELYDFINVWDPYRQTEFHKYYDVNSTPTIFVLDEDKTIIGKKIAVEDIPSFTQHYLDHGKADREGKKMTDK